ncbi:MAG: OmpA family protein [Pedobacter sp.]|nr:MAG: OmpA family protein [Pedobacter sp.]
MAHLEVEPKPSRPWWIWALLTILMIALAAMVFRQCTADEDGHPADAKPATGSDIKHKAVAATAPDWEHIDFSGARSVDPELNATDIYTQTNGAYTIYTLGENILFPAQGKEISSDGAVKLGLINAIIKEKFTGATIGIFGNTDSTGLAPANKRLAMERASAVKRWFTLHGSIPEAQLSVRSLGETQPIAQNGTKEGRAQNRNVAIVIFPKK